MSFIYKIQGYKTSKDYTRLLDLMKTQSIICIVDYGTDCRDVAHTIFESYERHPDNPLMQVSARGIGYLHTNSPSEFIRQCEKYNLEFIEPEEVKA